MEGHLVEADEVDAESVIRAAVGGESEQTERRAERGQKKGERRRRGKAKKETNCLSTLK